MRKQQHPSKQAAQAEGVSLIGHRNPQNAESREESRRCRQGSI
jgi:hypothetical protein